MEDAGHGDARTVRIACAGCDTPMSFGSSECLECGTRYRYVEGRAVAESLDELEADEAAERAALEAAARASATGFHPPLGVVQRAESPIVRPRKGLALGTVLALAATLFLGVTDTGVDWLVRFLVSRGYTTLDLDAFFFLASGRAAVRWLMGVGAALLFVLWMRDSNRVARALGAEGLRYTPADCVFWWFVPIANFVVPYRTMVELWKASQPRAGATDWARGRVSSAVRFWWGAWLGAWLFDLVLTRVYDQGQTTAVYDVIPALVTWISAMTANLLSGILAAWIVWNVHKRLEEKANFNA